MFTNSALTLHVRGISTLGVLLVFASPAQGYGQSIRGRTVETASGRPLTGVEITVYSGDRQLGRAFSDSTGLFSTPGTRCCWQVFASCNPSLGFARLDSVFVDVGAREMVELTLSA